MQRTTLLVYLGVICIVCGAAACETPRPSNGGAPTTGATAAAVNIHDLVTDYLNEQKNPLKNQDIWEQITAKTGLDKNVWHEHQLAALKEVDGRTLLVVPGRGVTIYIEPDLSKAWIK